MAYDNFGILLKKGVSVVGNFVSLDLPEVVVAEVETTNHASTAAEFVPGGVPNFGTFGGKMEVTSPTLSGLMNDLINKTVSTYTIEFPDDTGVVDYTGSAFLTSVKLESADAQKADELLVTVVFRTTGDWAGNWA